MKLWQLNVDCFCKICSYLDDNDLINLSLANEHLSYVIERNVLYRRTLDLLLCGHRDSPAINARSLWPLNYMVRLRIGQNWLAGRYYEHQYFHHSRIFPTRLILERYHLHLTHGSYIRSYKRELPEPLQRRYLREIQNGSVRSDLADMAKRGDTFFAANVCGNSFIYECPGDTTNGDAGVVCSQRLHGPKEYVYCVDFAGAMYASSTDKSGILWRREEEFGVVHLERQRVLQRSYKVLRFNEIGDRLIGGVYTDLDHRALREIDLHTGVEYALNSNTLSIYDLKMKDEHILFTANFDSTFRLHDRRSGRDEMIYEDPFDSSFYCLTYDGLHAVLCGAKYHGRVNLYDIRVPEKYIQLYFPYRGVHDRNGRNRGCASSPVYSVACDSRFLFVATDRNVRVFDFKADCAESRDYSDPFSTKSR